MNIVFMGTPDFAVPSLKSLLHSHHHIAAVITTPDLPRGRGQKISSSPVKIEAQMHGLSVLQPSSLKDADFQEKLRHFNADLFVVVAFRILPKEVFTIPSNGTINLHASLLPKYRGAAPLNWAIINGEKETGVTTFFIQEKVDTGNLIFQKKVAIGEDMTVGELHDQLMIVGADLLLETVNAIEEGSCELRKQIDADATPAPKIFRETCRIDWSRSAREIHNHVRGLSPYPGAWTTHKQKQLNIYRTKVLNLDAELPAGSVIVEANHLSVATGKGILEILELKPEGRKRMTSEEFLRGYQMRIGETLGDDRSPSS